MKVLVIGGTGTIGKYIVEELSSDTDIITAGFQSGDIQVDIADMASISSMYEKIGPINGLISVAARGVVLKHISEMTVEDYRNSLTQKCFGQIQLVLAGLRVMQPDGCFTLTTGIMNRDFIMHGSAASMTNSAVEGFVKASALEMPNGIRINAISPALLEDSADAYKTYCPGFELVNGAKVARTYRRSQYGIQTGHIFHVG